MDDPKTASAAGPAASEDPIRERLLASAAEVFGEVGYDRAGVQAIASRAGYTTGAIYGRFRGKADLLLAAIEVQSHDELADLFADQAEEDVGSRAYDILTTLGAHLVVDEFDHGQALLLEAFVAARREPELARMLRKLLAERAGELTHLVDEAQAAGVIDPELDPLSIVIFCHAVSLGFLLLGALEVEGPESDPWEALIQRLVGAVAERPEEE